MALHTERDSLKRSSRHSSRGFSLVEVTIALAILVIGLLGLHAMSMMIVNGSAVAQKMSTAGSLGQEVLEQVKSGGYDAAIQDSYPQEDFGSITGYAQYRRALVIQQATPETDMKTVTVTVSWRGDLDGTIKSVVFSTILTAD